MFFGLTADSNVWVHYTGILVMISSNIPSSLLKMAWQKISCSHLIVIKRRVVNWSHSLEKFGSILTERKPKMC